MVQAIELMQDVQLACFAVIFTCMALSNRGDRTLRLIWYGFLVDGTAGIIDLLSAHLPRWLAFGVNYESSLVSYGLLTLAVATFIERERWTRWITVSLLALSLPIFLLWSGRADQVPSIAIIDFTLFLQTACAAWVLLRGQESSTFMARLNMSVFLALYAAVELYRVGVVALLHTNPDTVFPLMQSVTAVVYVVSGSVLPLGVIWMMNARMKENLMALSLLDPLTEILNRRGLEDAARRELSRYSRTRQDFTVAVVDIDHFKRLNDTYGHAFGDEVLRRLAVLFRQLLRQSDIISRSGGEEFILLLPVTTEEDTFALLDRIRTVVEGQTIHLGDTSVQATISIGTTNTAGRWNPSWRNLQEEADKALYAAKRGGRNRTIAYAATVDDIPSIATLAGPVSPAL
jgi:diguanylate cyclase (GGDEF)-like protein